jgi:hypothetical protein
MPVCQWLLEQIRVDMVGLEGIGVWARPIVSSHFRISIMP